jgi:hypothetical protein
VAVWLVVLLLAGGLELLGEEAEEEGSEPKLDVRWYGYIKLDASWDESLIDPGNFARWVASPSEVEEHSHFNMTARQSRLGIDLGREIDEGLEIGGKIEIDFYGGGAENKNQPQLRHAYMDLDWPERDLRLRAGQTSDVVSPLVPTTLNYTVAWWVGNIGYRRPLAALTKSWGADDASRTQLTLAVARTIGDDFGAVDPGDSGADSGLATIQGAVSRSFTAAGRAGRLGISGHWGTENLKEQIGDAELEVDSWSANVDLVVPMGSRFTFKGEAWTGQNLDDYFGGIAQGIDFQTGEAIEAYGGWATVELRASDSVLTSVGFGLDDPDDELLPVGGRSYNQSIWANVLWDIRKVLTFGVELSYWQTDYLSTVDKLGPGEGPPGQDPCAEIECLEYEDGESFRAQASLIYRFGK